MSELRSIKFTNKKVVMKPQKKGFGITEVWTPNLNTTTPIPLQFIIHDGVRYFLQSVNEKLDE